MKDILDMHTHTIASGHAYSTIREMAEAARIKKLQLLGITEHAPTMPGTCHEMYFRNFKVIDRTAYGVEILLGSELNIMDFFGNIDLSVNVLKKIDYTIASLHDQCLNPGSLEQNTTAVIKAMQNPYVTIIGHPDDGHFALDYKAIAKAAKDANVLIELNSSSLRPGSHRLNARENITCLLNYCKHYETSIVVNSDAHIDLDVGNHRLAHELLAELNFPETLIVNTAVDKFKNYLTSHN